MHFALYISSLGPGGAERVISNLANQLSADQHQVTLITHASLTADHYRVAAGVTRLSLNASRISTNAGQAAWENFRRIRRLRQVLRRIKPNTLLTFMPSANVAGLIAAGGLGLRVVVAERTHPPLTGLDRIREWLRK